MVKIRRPAFELYNLSYKFIRGCVKIKANLIPAEHIHVTGENILKHIFIINPAAGKVGSSQKPEAAIRDAVSKTGAEFEIIFTNAPGHATELAKQYTSGNNKVRLYACGGDGTVNEVVNGMYGAKNCSLAIVPCGTGNDFIRTFGKKSDFMDIGRLISGDPVKTDIIRAGEKLSINICSAGFDAAVAYATPKFKRLPFLGGDMSYNAAVIEQLLLPLGSYFYIETDGKKREGEYLLVCMANGRCYGGGFTGAPLARTDDGLLDIIMVKKVSRLRIARVIGLYKSGEHLTADGRVIEELRDVMDYVRGREITITSAKNFIGNTDGECAPTSVFEAKILPGAIELVLPAGLGLRR